MSAPSERRRGVVTGAGSGIGKAVVRRLLREGADVLAVALAAASLAELKGAHCETLAGDVTDPAVRAKLADWADGGDYLVNSAGIIVIKPIFDVTVDDWRRVQTVNAEATFFLCQKIGPRLKPGGAIVNLSSSSAKLATTIEVAAYAASKAASRFSRATRRPSSGTSYRARDSRSTSCRRRPEGRACGPS